LITQPKGALSIFYNHHLTPFYLHPSEMKTSTEFDFNLTFVKS